jgi:hypothetical protein
MEAKVKFKDPDMIINVNGQKIHPGNLTQEDYEYLLSWNKDYASLFVPLETVNLEAKSKKKSDGKAAEESKSE